jgi:hypothetical protein
LSLETYSTSDDLYLARGGEVNAYRPLFTGDVVIDADIPGVQESGMAMVIDHPCSMRGAHAQLASTLLVVAVREHAPVGPQLWTRGYFGLMPLPGITGQDFHVARLDQIGRTSTTSLLEVDRVACLSVFGVNLLQQRLIWHLTRFEVPTFRLQEAFSHTYEEADLLEEWVDTLANANLEVRDATARFEEFIRMKQPTGRTMQDDLRDAQLRSAVRGACRAEARRIAGVEQYGPR